MGREIWRSFPIRSDPHWLAEVTSGGPEFWKSWEESVDSLAHFSLTFMMPAFHRKRVKILGGLCELLLFISEGVVKFSTDTGIICDPIYIGKTARAMVLEMKTNPSRFKGSRVLFIHTGKYSYHVCHFKLYLHFIFCRSIVVHFLHSDVNMSLYIKCVQCKSTAYFAIL